MRIPAPRVLAACGLAVSALVAVACSPSGVLRPDVDVTRTAAVMMPAPGLQRLVPSNPYLNAPPEPREFSQAPGVMPESEIECRRQLKRLNVAYRDLPALGRDGACQVDFPVEVAGIGSVAMKPSATLSCQMALSVARWTREELVPSSRLRYFSGVKAIHQGSSYSCRRIRGSGTMSEHSKGNALDIMRIELNSGKDIGVRKPGFFSFRERGLLNNVRADACGYFTTVLGPGYDRDHKDHFHFDIAQRRNGHRACR